MFLQIAENEWMLPKALCILALRLTVPCVDDVGIMPEKPPIHLAEQLKVRPVRSK